MESDTKDHIQGLLSSLEGHVLAIAELTGDTKQIKRKLRRIALARRAKKPQREPSNNLGDVEFSRRGRA